MELQFQSPQSRAQQQCHYQVPVVAKETDKPSRARSKCGGGKFVGVRQRPSGRWVAEIKDTTQKIRMWLGTFETAEEAARAYDEAACLLRGANTRTNFAAAAAPDSPVASRIRALLSHKKLEKNVPQQPAIAFSPTAYRHGCGIGSITAATSTSASTVTTTTTSVSPSSSASSATINFAMSSCVRTPILPVPAHHTVTDEEAYRSYLISGGSEEFQLASQQPWAPNASLPPREGPDMGTDNTWSAMAELEKIDPPEMESPASSHGVDRVRDQDFYDDTGNDPSDSCGTCRLSARCPAGP